MGKPRDSTAISTGCCGFYQAGIRIAVAPFSFCPAKRANGKAQVQSWCYQSGTCCTALQTPGWTLTAIGESGEERYGRRLTQTWARKLIRIRLFHLANPTMSLFLAQQVNRRGNVLEVYLQSTDCKIGIMKTEGKGLFPPQPNDHPNVMHRKFFWTLKVLDDVKSTEMPGTTGLSLQRYEGDIWLHNTCKTLSLLYCSFFFFF